MRHEKKYARVLVYFDFSSDFVYLPAFNSKDIEHPPRSTAPPGDIFTEHREKVKNVVQGVSKHSVDFFSTSLYYSSATNAVLVLEGERMSQGSAELSDFFTTTEDFPWQKGRSLSQIYHSVSQTPAEAYADRS